MIFTVPRIARLLAGLTSRSALHGAEYLPRHGPALLVINHTTIADVPVVLTALDRHGLRPIAPDAPGHSSSCSDHAHLRFLATEDVFRHPLIGRAVRQSGFIPVLSAGLGRVGAYDSAVAALRAGDIVALYPEGDVTSPDEGAPRRLRSGAARLALAEPVPIVPIAHHDARDIGTGSEAETLRRAATAIWRRPYVQLAVGRAIQPAEYEHMLPLDVTRLIRARLTETWQVARGLRDARNRQSQPDRLNRR